MVVPQEASYFSHDITATRGLRLIVMDSQRIAPFSKQRVPEQKLEEVNNDKQRWECENG